MDMANANPQERIGLWVLTNLGLPDEISSADAGTVIERLGNSSIPDALGDIAFDIQGDLST